jgi:hypothetical protein
LYLDEGGDLLDLVPGTLGAEVHEASEQDGEGMVALAQRLLRRPGLALGRDDAQGGHVVQPAMGAVRKMLQLEVLRVVK